MGSTLESTKKISLEDSQRIEQTTPGQHSSSAWKDYHTNFVIVCKCKEVTDVFIKWLLIPFDAKLYISYSTWKTVITNMFLEGKSLKYISLHASCISKH